LLLTNAYRVLVKCSAVQYREYSAIWNTVEISSIGSKWRYCLRTLPMTLWRGVNISVISVSIQCLEKVFMPLDLIHILLCYSLNSKKEFSLKTP
jgi:hypothetical protein